MPIYAYRCATCGHAQDVLQKISDPVLTVCPACGNATYQKQVTAAGFQLKGSGWYVTDFRGDKATAKPADAGAAGAAAGSEGKGDAKAESGGTAAASGNGEGSAGAKAGAPPPAATPSPAPAASSAPPPSPSGKSDS